MPFFLISFFALTMSVFIIYSSYKVITLDRLPVIGTFRSIGATQKVVTRILLLESGLYGVLGGLIGIPVGTLILKLILQGMGQSLSQGIEIPVVISPFSIIFSFAVAVVVSLLSAWLPVRCASRLPIKDVVLGSVEEKQVPRRFIVGDTFRSVCHPSKVGFWKYAVSGRRFFPVGVDCSYNFDCSLAD